LIHAQFNLRELIVSTVLALLSINPQVKALTPFVGSLEAANIAATERERQNDRRWSNELRDFSNAHNAFGELSELGHLF